MNFNDPIIIDDPLTNSKSDSKKVSKTYHEVMKTKLGDVCNFTTVITLPIHKDSFILDITS